MYTKIKDIYSQNGLVIQDGSYTCGPSALLNVLRLKGDISFTENELAKRCDAEPGIGSTHEDMVRVALEVGLVLVKEQRDSAIEDIEHHINHGAFIIVNYMDAFSGNGHYAVITEQDKKAFYLRDSSMGFLRLEKIFFEKVWQSSDGIPRWYMAVK